jgi:hypothetical protein
VTTVPDLTNLYLDSGAHATAAAGLCLLEAVAWFRGVPHTDHPPCVSPVLGAYGRALNDRLPDDARQALVPFVPRMPGTAGDGLDVARLNLITRWLLTDYAARWLDVAGLEEAAARLRLLTPASWPDDAAAYASDASADASAAAATAAADAASAAVAADAAADADPDAAADASASASDAAAAAASAADAYDADAAVWAWKLRDLGWTCRNIGYRCARVVALRAVQDIRGYDQARSAAEVALAPYVAEFRSAGVVLLDAMIAPAASDGV